MEDKRREREEGLKGKGEGERKGWKGGGGGGEKKEIASKDLRALERGRKNIHKTGLL